MTTKIELRIHFRVLRRQVAESARGKEAASNAFDYLTPAAKNFSNVLSFASFGSELDLWVLNRSLAQEKRLLLPKITPSGLSIYFVKNLEQDLLVHPRFSILEPKNNCLEIGFDLIDCVLVPALAFDSNNHRLGYGKAYYDRLLKLLPKAVKLGIGFTEQRHTSLLPVEPHDERVDEVLLF